MGKATIRTNYHWRQLRYRYEVPAEILASEFDWCDSDDGFFCYLGTWYHLSQFMRGGAEGWQGSAADSAFSGTLINVSDDGETYQIARWYC